jgi:hypothetical protein
LLTLEFAAAQISNFKFLDCRQNLGLRFAHLTLGLPHITVDDLGEIDVGLLLQDAGL